MNKILPFASLLIASAALADDGFPEVDLRAPAGHSFTVGIGAAYRGGMKFKAKGGGSHAAGVAYSSSRTSGAAANGNDSESANFSFGYTGGDRTFGSGTSALGSGTVHADGTYEGGDYSPVYDDVYFSDNRTTTETVGGVTSTKSSASVSGMTAWENGGDASGWGFRADAGIPLADFGRGFSISAFAGFGGWWGIDGESSGRGPAVNYRSSVSTSGAQTKTTESFYDLTAPLDLSGKLDFDNAEVFEGSVVKYTPAKGTSSSRSSSALSLSKIEAEADLYQAALGASIGFELGRWVLSARPALLLNDIDVEATRTEILASQSGKVMGSWRDAASKNRFAIGAGALLSLECSLGESWSAVVSGGYEWVDSVDMEIGQQKVEIDMSAWTASAGVARRF